MIGKVVAGAIAYLVIGSLFVISWLVILGVYELPKIGGARQTGLSHMVIYAAGPVLLLAGLWWLATSLIRRKP